MLQLFPSFSFDESNVGPRAVRTASVDRIGFAGQFQRGPLAPVLVDPRAAEMTFGFTDDVGSVHLQASIAQGASDYAVVNVRPVGAPSSLNATFTGTATAAGTLDVAIKRGSTTLFTANGIAVGSGDTGSTVASAVKAALEAAAAAASKTDVKFAIPADSTGTNGKVVATSKVVGTSENLLKMVVTVTTVAGLTYGPTGLATTGGAAFTGGKDDPATAKLVLKDADGTDSLDVELVTTGILGNDTVLTVTAGAEDNLFDAVVENPTYKIREVFRGVDMTDLYDEDKLAAFRASNLIRVRKKATGLIPAPIANAAFTGGSDGGDSNVAGGTQPDTAAFIAAIDQLEDVQCTIIVCPGLKPAGVDQDAINTALYSQAERVDGEMGELLGLRIAVISAPRGTTINDLAALKSSGKVPNSKRCVMVVGWGTLASRPRFKRFGIDPAAVYAGHLVVTPIHVSPAARTSSPVIRGLQEVDTPVGINAWNEITKTRLEAIILDPVVNGFHCLNGRTTSSDSAWYWVCIRRVYDRIRTDVFFNLQFIKSEPSDPALDVVVESTVNNYLSQLMHSKVIVGYDPAVSNDSNNDDATRAAGKRFVDFGIQPVYPNDYTQFNINRVLSASVRLA